MSSTRKKEILETAMKLFSKNGYTNTSTAQIAKEAGVSEGLIFRHYSSKEQLLNEIIEAGLEQIKISMTAFLKTENEKSIIENHITSVIKIVKQHQKFWKLVHRLRFQKKIQLSARDKINEANEFILKTLTKHFKNEGYKSPVEEAILYFATIDGMVIHYLENPDHYPIDKIKKLIIQKYETR